MYNKESMPLYFFFHLICTTMMGGNVVKVDFFVVNFMGK